MDYGLTELLPDQLIRPGDAAKAFALSARSLTRIDPVVLPQIRMPGLKGTVRYRLSDVERLIAGIPETEHTSSDGTGPAQSGTDRLTSGGVTR